MNKSKHLVTQIVTSEEQDVHLVQYGKMAWSNNRTSLIQLFCEKQSHANSYTQVCVPDKIMSFVDVYDKLVTLTFTDKV